MCVLLWAVFVRVLSVGEQTRSIWGMVFAGCEIRSGVSALPAVCFHVRINARSHVGLQYALLGSAQCSARLPTNCCKVLPSD